MITVGLDFGTHQTKICIENKDGVELSYTFMKFEDTYRCESYTLPSIVGIGHDGLLSYGYLSRRYNGCIVRYFKQSAFRPSSHGMSPMDAMYFSIWYLAYILFDLEEKYGQEFTIQMGAPTDSSHVDEVKHTATRIIASAYRLVEDVFANDKHKFLSTSMEKLKNMTKIVAYSDEIKEEYGLLVFPEAYACLKPLISQGKLATGMSLMIDIGGGTTDISFFTIENNNPQVYEFYSINKGLNYLTRVNEYDQDDIMDYGKKKLDIVPERRMVHWKEVDSICYSIRIKLRNEFKAQTNLNVHRLFDALKDRPVVYCGGGSTYNILRKGFWDFRDIKQISPKEWNTKSIQNIEEIIDEELCPILSTAYGLAISTENDNIQRKPLKDIFEFIRGAEEEPLHSTSHDTYFGSAYGGFNYADDWDAWK